MKKLFYSVFVLIFLLFPVGVLAEGYVSVSPNSLTIEQGSSKTFTITAFNAIGDVSISSNNSGVASVNTSEWGTGMVDEKQTKTGNVTVTGNSVGTTTITLTIDAATFDGDDLAGQTKQVTVNVVEKPAPSPTPTPSPEPPAQNNNQQQNNLSKNNNIKSLSVEGYELVKVDNNNYTLTVATDVNSVSINATAEDSKAKITGIGVKALKVGENNIQVIVTSESGAPNTININITRKDGYYLEDLDLILSNPNIQDADIIINTDSKITKEHLNKIKNNKKIIRLNYYDETKKLVYMWTISGNKIEELNEFTTTINFTTENKKDIYKLSNYADGLYVNFAHAGDLPIGTKIKLFVGDKFENESTVNVYYYNISKNSLDVIQKSLKVSDGYIEFDIDHCSEYFVTMSNILNFEQLTEQSKDTSVSIVLIIGIIIIIGLILFIFFNKKKLKNSEDDNNFTNSTSNVNSLNNNIDEIENSNIVNVENSNSLGKETNNTFNSYAMNQFSTNNNLNKSIFDDKN